MKNQCSFLLGVDWGRGGGDEVFDLFHFLKSQNFFCAHCECTFREPRSDVWNITMSSSLSIKQMLPASWVHTTGCILIILSWYAAEAGAVLHCSMSALRLPAPLSACLQAGAAQPRCGSGARGNRWWQALHFQICMWHRTFLRWDWEPVFWSWASVSVGFLLLWNLFLNMKVIFSYTITKRKSGSHPYSPVCWVEQVLKTCALTEWFFKRFNKLLYLFVKNHAQVSHT